LKQFQNPISKSQDTLNTHIHDLSLSSLGTDTSIKIAALSQFYRPKPWWNGVMMEVRRF